MLLGNQKKHTQCTSRLVRVGVGEIVQMDDGIIHSKWRLVDKLKGT